MTKFCILQLTPDELCFNVGDERVPVLWAVLSHEHFFTEYIMVGVCEDENEIYLEFDASMFARSLNSLRATAKSVKIKLTNKRQPCLTFEIDLSSLAIETRQCMHDVPVRLIPRREWQEHKMPIIPEFDVRHVLIVVIHCTLQILLLTKINVSVTEHVLMIVTLYVIFLRKYLKFC